MSYGAQRRNRTTDTRIFNPRVGGSTNCEAVSNERASAKPAGDKQAKACLDSSAPEQHLSPTL